jgi:hypothetical protein
MQGGKEDGSGEGGGKSVKEGGNSVIVGGRTHSVMPLVGTCEPSGHHCLWSVLDSLHNAQPLYAQGACLHGPLSVRAWTVWGSRVCVLPFIDGCSALRFLIPTGRPVWPLRDACGQPPGVLRPPASPHGRHS